MPVAEFVSYFGSGTYDATGAGHPVSCTADSPPAIIAIPLQDLLGDVIRDHERLICVCGCDHHDLELESSAPQSCNIEETCVLGFNTGRISTKQCSICDSTPQVFADTTLRIFSLSQPLDFEGVSN